MTGCHNSHVATNFMFPSHIQRMMGSQRPGTVLYEQEAVTAIQFCSVQAAIPFCNLFDLNKKRTQRALHPAEKLMGIWKRFQ